MILKNMKSFTSQKLTSCLRKAGSLDGGLFDRYVRTEAFQERRRYIENNPYKADSVPARRLALPQRVVPSATLTRPERGRPVRCLFSFALRAQCGRDVRAPSIFLSALICG
jgi:hypothetical protein